MAFQWAKTRRSFALAGALTMAVAIAPVGIGRTAAVSLGAATPDAPAPDASEPLALPATPDGPVPIDLRPSLAAAGRDYPRPYLDGCHVEQTGRSSKRASCLYGTLSSPTTIGLLGGSPARSWFPAVERVARRQGWRLHVLTMSACSPADIPNWNTNFGRVSTECTAWRKRTIRQIAAEHPAIVLVAGTRGFATVDSSGALLTGDARTRAWQAGMKRTLDRLVPVASRVIVIGDVPLSGQDPPACLSANTTVLACATPVSAAIDEAWLADEQRAAEVSSAGFIDPTRWVCPSSPCPVVIGKVLVFRDQGHLTAVFARSLGDRLRNAIIRDLKKSLGVTTFD